MPWLVTVLFAGAVALWARLIGGWLVVSKLRSTLVRTAPPEWRESLDRLRVGVGVSTPVRWLSSALVMVPTVVGWLRPAILLPVGALTGMAPQYIAILLPTNLPTLATPVMKLTLAGRLFPVIPAPFLR